MTAASILDAPPCKALLPPIPVALAIVTFGLETVIGNELLSMFKDLGLGKAPFIDLRPVLALSKEQADHCCNYDGTRERVQHATIGHREFLATMLVCLEDSTEDPMHKMRVLFRVCGDGLQKSVVVGSMDVEALNSMYIWPENGDAKYPLFNAKLFPLHCKSISEIRSPLEDAKKWTWEEDEVDPRCPLVELYLFGYEACRGLEWISTACRESIGSFGTTSSIGTPSDPATLLR